MTKERYLEELMMELEGMSAEERREISADYEEHFRAGLAGGKTEEEICRSLGNPRTIGRSYRIDAMLEQERRPSAAVVLRAVFASLSLGFFNIVLVLGPFLVIVAAVVALWAAAASIGVSGVGLVLGAVARPIFPHYLPLDAFHPAFLFTSGIAFAALGLLALIGMWQLTRKVLSVTGSYVRLNLRIVTQRR